MIWGLHGGGWMSGIYHRAPDPYMAQIELLAEHGLQSTGWGTKNLMAMEPARREQLISAARGKNIEVGLGLPIDWLIEDESVFQGSVEAAKAAVQTLAKPFRSRTCLTGINRKFHHYSRDVTIDRQIEILSKRMAAMARFCQDAGCPMCIHTVTHFGRDMAELCRRTPGLALCFDTANCLLIGEVPLDAAREVAPFTRSTHFKDHYAFPSFDPLGLRVRGAIPGEGDCNLREIYRILVAKAPDPKNLVMELEIDPVQGEDGKNLDQRDVLRKSVQFIRSLEA